MFYFKFHEMHPKPATPISVMESAMGLFIHYGFSQDWPMGEILVTVMRFAVSVGAKEYIS